MGKNIDKITEQLNSNCDNQYYNGTSPNDTSSQDNSYDSVSSQEYAAYEKNCYQNNRKIIYIIIACLIAAGIGLAVYYLVTPRVPSHTLHTTNERFMGFDLISSSTLEDNVSATASFEYNLLKDNNDMVFTIVQLKDGNVVSSKELFTASDLSTGKLIASIDSSTNELVIKLPATNIEEKFDISDIASDYPEYTFWGSYDYNYSLAETPTCNLLQIVPDNSDENYEDSGESDLEYPTGFFVQVNVK